MAANTSQSQKGSSSRRGGSMLQKIALKKEQLKLYPRMKKIERIGTKLACQVTQRDGCICQGWKPTGAPPTESSLPRYSDTCKVCHHTLEYHTLQIKELPDEQIDRVLMTTYDMDNILAQMRNDREDQELRKTYNFLWHFLKKNLLLPRMPSLSGDKFGSPPFEKPTVAKAVTNFVSYKFNNLPLSEWRNMYELAKMFLYCFNHWKLEPPSTHSHTTPTSDQRVYRENYIRWVCFCHVPVFCESLQRFDATHVFGRTLLASVFHVMRKQLMEKFTTEQDKMLPEKRSLVLNHFPKFLNLLDVELFSSSPIWRDDFTATADVVPATLPAGSSKMPTPSPAAGPGSVRIYSVNPDDAKASLGVTVTMNITNIGAQGYPGTGKTSILDLAMGKEPALERTSTGCVDPPSRYMLIIGEDSAEDKWENITTDKMFDMVCGAVKKTIEETPVDMVQSLHFDNPVTGSCESLFTSDTEYGTSAVGNELVPPTAAAATGNANQIPAAAEPSLDDDSYSPYTGFTWFLDLLKELHSSASSGVIFNSHWMMVTDCGGQPPFLDAAALFLRNSCLQIFPLKLNEPLSKIPEYSYFFNGMSANCDQFDLQLSNRQIMETLAKSVASIQPPYTPSATECPKGAKFIIVGTFEDEAHHCSETVAEKESILEKVLEPYEAFRVQLGSKVILPVNAIAIDTETKKERTESAKKLRRLFRKANVTMKIDVKLRWFGFLLIMLTIAEKDGKAILTLSECYRLGDSLKMDKSETKKAIRFFHDINLIMYFDTPKLRDSVIIDTKPVLNKLSRLITLSFLDEDFLTKHYDGIDLPSGTKELLQHHGRFTRSTLESCVEFFDSISSQFFLDILEHVKIVAAIDQTPEYFMPCALPYATEIPHSSHAWVIRLRVRRGVDEEYVPIPVGYLPTILVFLLTIFSCSFSLIRHKRQYRNVINLAYRPGGMVCLVEHHLQLEVHYSCCFKLQQECTVIRNHVLESINLTEEKLHIQESAITKVDSFPCSCGKASPHHVCTFNPQTRIVECEKTREVFELEPYHQFWLAASPSTTCTGGSDQLPTAPPTLLKLKTMKGADGKSLKIIQTIAAHDFITFGMCLLQDENGEEVDLIEKNHISKGADGVTKAILQKWLSSDAPTRTYQYLIECLRQSELGALAERIANTKEAKASFLAN